ncbi:MAG: putative ABC transporter ATP-binding protein YknY [Phycisphaerae bacterium]|nr:putative ABC transporter ATP-binding protein YknY [Phycisphaerae bacterium]
MPHPYWRGRLISEKILHIENLVKVYGSGSTAVRALDGVNLEVHSGRFVAVMGSSGSGKSTLLHMIGGLDRPSGGHIHIRGQEITSLSDSQLTLFRRRHLGIIFQSFNLLPMLTAEQNIALPLMLDGRPKREVRARVAELMDICRLTHRADHLPDALSGGEQQRVAIARALMNEPALLLADEPTGNLDSSTAEAILAFLRRLVSDMNKTVVMVTHEPKAAALSDVLVVLRDGCIIERADLDGSGDTAKVIAHYNRDM